MPFRQILTHLKSGHMGYINLTNLISLQSSGEHPLVAKQKISAAFHHYKGKKYITWMLHQIFMYSNKVMLAAG